MFVTAFHPFDSYANTAAAKVADINEIADYRYKKHFYKIGEFSMTVPETDDGAKLVKEGMLLLVTDPESVNDYLYVSEAVFSYGKYTFSGYDLKYLLTQRVTLFPQGDVEAGTYGYDCRTGWTSSIIAGYINYNLCGAADEKRKMPHTACSASPAGIENDTYMSRLQRLNEVVEALCKNAHIGYEAVLEAANIDTPIWFRVLSGRDIREKGYVFGKFYGNVSDVSKKRINEAEKNTVWAVNGTGADNATVTAVHLGSTEASGFARKETVAEMNCDTDEVEIYARHSVSESSPVCEIEAVTDGKYYGSLYIVGDLVRFAEKYGEPEDMRIMAVEKQYSGHSRKLRLYFESAEAPSPAKTLNRIADAQSRLEKSIIDQKLDGGGGGGGEGGLSIQNAVILNEADASYILHNFTQVEYMAGNKIGYAGAGNQIIVDGYLFYYNSAYKDFLAAVYNKEIYPHTSLEFQKAGRNLSSMIENLDFGLYWEYINPVGQASSYGWESAGLGNYQSGTSTTYDTSLAGFILTYSTIFPPSEAHPNGYILGSIGIICKTPAAATYLTRYRSESMYIDFASETEYNAAVGLTYEPVTKYSVTDTTTIV